MRGRRRNCCGWTDGTGIESFKRGPKNILSWFLLVCPCIFFIFRISKAIWGVFSDTSNPHSTQGMLFFSTPSEDMCLTRGKCIPKNRPNIPLRYQSQTGNIRWCSGWKLIFSKKLFQCNRTPNQVCERVKGFNNHYRLIKISIYDSVWYPPEPWLLPQLLVPKVPLEDRWPMTTLQSHPTHPSIQSTWELFALIESNRPQVAPSWPPRTELEMNQDKNKQWQIRNTARQNDKNTKRQ